MHQVCTIKHFSRLIAELLRTILVRFGMNPPANHGNTRSDVIVLAPVNKSR